jgi:hypothetical protein
MSMGSCIQRPQKCSQHALQFLAIPRGDVKVDATQIPRKGRIDGAAGELFLTAVWRVELPGVTVFAEKFMH